MFEFLRESTPERERLRYGDLDYDWEHRVNTTEAAVSTRARLIGTLARVALSADGTSRVSRDAVVIAD